MVACDKKTGELTVNDDNLDLLDANLKSLKAPDVRAVSIVRDSTSRLKIRDMAYVFVFPFRARPFKTYL